MRRILALALAILAGGAAAAPIVLTEGVRWLPGGFLPGRQPDGNSVCFDGERGTLLVDTGRHVAHTEAALDAAGPGGPLAVLVTHWHLDHLGGVALLRARSPKVPVWGSAAVGPALNGWLADSRKAMLSALARGGVDATTAEAMRIDIALGDSAERLLPDRVIEVPETTTLIGRPLSLFIERHAVTAADLWVWDPASRVLAAGDLVTFPVPFLDTACPAGWRAALDRLAAQPAAWIVPGHGRPLSAAEFDRWHGAFNALLDCAAGGSTTSACADGWIADLGPLLPPADHERARAMLDYYFAEHLRAGPGRRDRFCAESR